MRATAWGRLSLGIVLLAFAPGCAMLLGDFATEGTAEGPDATAPDATGPDAVAVSPKHDASVSDADGGLAVQTGEAGGGEGGCDPTSVQSCGRCDNDCTRLPHVSVAGLACTDGHCSYRCAAGYGDCADAGNGCVTLTASANCGACGVICSGATPVCASADGGTPGCAAACPTAQTNCSGSCADLSRSADHCGTCASACASAQICDGGVCQCPSAANPDFCAGSCTNVQTDKANCGSCGHACGGGQTCSGGFCGCPVGTTLCGNTCADTSSDAQHCGSSCALCSGGMTCQAGACKCPAGTTLCAGKCVNTATDLANCGACGQDCGQLPHVSTTGLSCSGGVCSHSSCAAGFGNCADAGVDAGCPTSLSTSSNCGACGTVCSGSTPACAQSGAGTAACASGCAAGQQNCSGTCSDLSSDPTHCGACTTACKGNQTCAGGTCMCASGRTLCGNACTNTQTDTANCGTCGHACPSNVSGASAVCSGGACHEACSNVSNAQCPSANPTACVDLSGDNNNCGQCGVTCGGGTRCLAGHCVCDNVSGCSGCCNATATQCLASGNASCGTGGATCTTCSNGAICSSGSCGCPGTGNTLSCSGSCVDPTKDPNCGVCGKSCSAIGQVCSGGTCACPSTGNTLSCSGSCVDPTKDGNCGSCGTFCSTTGRVCSGGTCGCQSGTYCPAQGGCKNLQADSNNCGSCGHVCPVNASCSGSACVARVGQTSSFQTCGSSSPPCGFTADGPSLEGYFLFAQTITLPDPITVTKLGVVVLDPAVAHAYLALYRDAAGIPGSLIVGTPSTGLVAGANEIGVSSTVLSAGTYWFAMMTDSNATITSDYCNCTNYQVGEPALMNGFQLPDPFSVFVSNTSGHFPFYVVGTE